MRLLQPTHAAGLPFAAALLIALIGAVLVGGSQSTSAEATTSATLLVSLAPDADPGVALSLFNAADARLLEQVSHLPIFRVVPRHGTSLDHVTRFLGESSLVRGVEVEGEQVIQVVPDDGLYRPYQWNLRRIGMEQVWDLRPTAPDIVVAVLDTGVDLAHPDLRDNLVLEHAYDFIHDRPAPQDDESHGTAVAGIVGAVGNNREGVAGIAWRVKILPIKALNSRGRGPDSAMVKAIVHAADAGARVINISSTGSRYSLALEQAVSYAREKGALVVAAAGNTGDQGNEVSYPAAFEGVLAVAAVDERDQVASFSQHGAYVALAAPGVDVPSTAWPGAGRGLYASQSGTSIAAPHVSGVAALIWSLRPDLSADQIAQVLRTTSDDLGIAGVDEGSGAGILNAGRAIKAVRTGVHPRPEATAAVPPEPTPAPVPAPPPLPLEPRRWYFAEGSTKANFETKFALFNPNARSTSVRLAFLSPEGRQSYHEVLLPANGRLVVSGNEMMPNAEFATIVQADMPVFAERSMHFGRDGHSATGASEPAGTWYLAEGSTAARFDTWILLSNPNPTPTSARLLFMHEDGKVVEHAELLPPWGRKSVYVNLLFQVPGFATQVEATQPIVVERAMYFDEGQGGHNTVASPAPAKNWFLAEGASQRDFETWLLVQNPGTKSANVAVTFFTDEGRTIRHSLKVGARSRSSLLANLVVPNAVFGMRVESDEPVVAERAVYLSGGGAGFASAGIQAAAREWYLPDGATNGAFVQQLAILNSDPVAASVEVHFRRQDGQVVPSQRFRVAPNTRLTVDVNKYLVDATASLKVIADRPVVVERTHYFATPKGIGASSSVGLTR